MAENAERNLRLYRELITCTHNLYYWTYDTRFAMVYTNCPSPELLNLLFISVSDFVPKDCDKPVLISSGLGFSWALNMERDGAGEPLYFHVIGPAMTSQISLDLMKKAITQKHGVSYSLTQSVEQLVSEIPAVPVARLLEYGLMLHYCIAEEKLTISDFVYPNTFFEIPKEIEAHTDNPHGTWVMEQKLLKLIEDGNLDFRKESSRLVAGAAPADLGSGDVMRHYKNLLIAFISSCTRAAIRGGLSPETAYLLSDKYIHEVESCNTLPDIAELNDTMQEDFVRRVHQTKTGGLSPQIQQVCDYIQLHVEDELSLAVVSAAIGYSPSWLSGKFRKETGKTLSRYIAEQKVERAKLLIRSDNRFVQEIADQLQFKTPSHFGAVFRQHTGMTPSEYRERAGR